MVAEEVEQSVCLAAARSQMHVGNEKRAISLRGGIRHVGRFVLLGIMPR
jgi:hypothetical protein